MVQLLRRLVSLSIDDWCFMRFFFLATLTMIFLGSGAQAANTSIPGTGGQTVMEFHSTFGGDLVFHAEVGQIEVMAIQTKAGEFTRLMIPGFHSSHEIGQPELPRMNRLISVPLGAEATITIDRIQSRTVKLADFGVKNLVLPAQPSLSKCSDPDQVEFQFDQAAYRAVSQPEDQQPVRLVALGTMRALQLGRVEVIPVQYLPAQGELRIVESIDFRVVFNGQDWKAAANLYAVTQSPFFNHLYDKISGRNFGEKSLQDVFPDRVANQVTMVIVTPPAFVSQLSNFVAWKTERGFKVITAVTGTPELGTSNSSIQSYLHGLYQNATVENPAPSFVVFVGDVEQLPTFLENGSATDKPYCAVDGDVVPDMFYGRLSASDPSQLQAILDKTLMYDQFTMPDASYLGEAVMVAGVDWGYGPTHGNGQINYGTEHYFNAAHGISSLTFLFPASNADGVSEEILSQVSNGAGFINYTGHATETSWVDPWIGQGALTSLQNENKYLLAVGNCCLSSSFASSECFGETWLRVPNKGAIGYIGGSDSTYWDEDYWWAVGAHSLSEIDGTAQPVENTGIGIYDGLFHEHGESPAQHYVTNDAIVFAGNLAVMESGSNFSDYYWSVYNLLGDPSLSPYLGIPTVNQVTVPGTVVSNADGVLIQADAGSYVGLTQDGILVGSGTVSEQGSLEVALNQTLEPGIPLHSVVMAQGRVPHHAEIAVVEGAQTTITPVSFPALASTGITVQVMEPDGTTPKPGVEIWIEWFLGEASVVMVTDELGQVEFSLYSHYCGELKIHGQVPGDDYEIFKRNLLVTGTDLIDPQLTVSNELGMTDEFAMNLSNLLTGSSATPGIEVVAVMPDGSLVDQNSSELSLTPITGGTITAYLRAPGSYMYTETFEVQTTGSIRGTVGLSGTGDESGVLVTAEPAGVSAVTDSEGAFLLTGLNAGAYQCTAVKFGYSSAEVSFDLGLGQHLEEMDFSLVPVYSVEFCDSPNLAIPDNLPSGIRTQITVPLDREITSIQLGLDLTHSNRGDLIVGLISPEGTFVLLHNQTGGSADDIVGTYPLDLVPVQSLDTLLGENMQGDWILMANDNNGGNTGVLNNWCLELGFPDDLSPVVSPVLPTVLVLKGNIPNPFNPTTKIQFDLPSETRVEMQVFDLKGRKVKSLISETLASGHHIVTWNGTDSSGQQVSSGTYFYRLKAGGESLTRKMLLLK